MRRKPFVPLGIKELRRLAEKYPHLEYEILHVPNPWMQDWKKLAYKTECLHARLGSVTITDARA